MAIQTTLVDDINGSIDDVQPVQFSVNGEVYYIDLCRALRDELTNSLATFVRHARKGRPQKNQATHQMNQEIREWARLNGAEIADRGRIPADIRARFEQENQR